MFTEVIFMNKFVTPSVTVIQGVRRQPAISTILLVLIFFFLNYVECTVTLYFFLSFDLSKSVENVLDNEVERLV